MTLYNALVFMRPAVKKDLAQKNQSVQEKSEGYFIGHFRTKSSSSASPPF